MNADHFCLIIEEALWGLNHPGEPKHVTDIRQVEYGLVVDIDDGSSFDISVNRQ